MNKLTAGIFAGILTIVTVNAARADIATTNYVNQNVNAKVGTLTALTTSERDNAVVAINEVNQAAKAAAAAATTAETNAKTYADGLNSAMDARVKANKAAIDVLNGDAQTEGSVANKITEATLDATADIKTDIQTLKGGADTVGSVANKIKTAIDDLDGNVTGSGVVKTISQENGVLTADLSAVAESDLDTALAGKINAKLDASTTKMAADGTYAKKTNTVGVNLTELDKGVVAAKAAADSAGTAAANALTDAKAYTDTREGAITTAYTGAINTAKAEIKTTTDGLDGRITANTNSINTLNGADTVEGSVDYKIKQKIDAVNSAASTLAGRVSANETAIQTLNGTGEGSVKKALADAKAYTDTRETAITTAYEAYADAAEADAVTTANQNTAGLLGDGVSTTNTVTKQFETTNANVTANAKAINDITKAGGTIDSKINDAKSALQGNIDGKVDVKTDLANKLLTTDATSGQLVSATATVAKPEKCTAQGAQCMLIDKGTGLEWELIVDTYAAN